MNPDNMKEVHLSPFVETEVTDIARAHFAEDFKDLYVATEDDQRSRGGWPNGMPAEFCENPFYQQVVGRLVAVQEIIAGVDARIPSQSFNMLRPQVVQTARRDLIDLDIRKIIEAEQTAQEHQSGGQS